MAIKDIPVADVEAEAKLAFAPALNLTMNNFRAKLFCLKNAPPQVLVFEGADKSTRMAMALWWTAALHCPNAGNASPCLNCQVCLRIGAGAYRDVLAYDGGISNKQEEENIGFVRAFNMDNIRTLKSMLSQAPHEAKSRVVILSGVEQSRITAANGLLKVLEEPSPNTIFVLLTAQRDQLLPTLVSRGWVYTLPWVHSGNVESSTESTLNNFEQELANFLLSGKGWFKLTSTKGAIDIDMAFAIILSCQRAISAAIYQNFTLNENKPYLAAIFSRHMNDAGKTYAISMLQKAQEALRYMVAPARVVDCLAVNLQGLIVKP